MKMSLLKRMLLYILFPTIIGLGILATVAGYIAKKDFITQADIQLEELASVQANEINNVMNYMKGIALTTSRLSTVINLAEMAIENPNSEEFKERQKYVSEYLIKSKSEYPDITVAYISDMKGVVIANTQVSSIGMEVGKFEAIQKALSGGIGLDARGSAVTGRFSAYIAVPVKNKSNKVVGSLTFTVDLATLYAKTAGTLELFPSSRTYIYNSGFEIIMDAEEQFLGTDDTYLPHTKDIERLKSGRVQFVFEDVESVGHFAYVPDYGWYVVIDTPVAEFDAPANELTFNIVILALIIIAIASLIIFTVARSIAKVMREGAEIALYVAAGNLEIKPEKKADMAKTLERGDEIADLARGMGIMIENLAQTVHKAEAATEEARQAVIEAEKAKEAANLAAEQASQARKEGLLDAAHQLESIVAVVASASGELSSQIERSTNSVGDQAVRIESTATSMDQMSATIIEVARSAVSSTQLTDTTKEKAIAGADVTKRCMNAITNVREDSLTLRSNMSALAEHAQSINAVMGVISDIADQTNLLALNAAIEAARAGEAGRGFAVVADEVRKLAEKTITSTSDVAKAISAIQQSTEENVKQVDIAVRGIEEATTLATQSGEALQDILEMADLSAAGVRTIATAAEEQASTVEEMTSAIDIINNTARETKYAMGEASTAVVSLSTQAQELSNIINNLKTA